MKLLIDTNVILDFLLERNSFGEDAKSIFQLAITNKAIECVSASAITDIFYIVNKENRNSLATQEVIKSLLNLVTILQVTDKEINQAIDLRWKDFEDAVQYSVALCNDVDCIITRNVNDYESPKIPILTPKEFLSQMN